MANLLKKVLDWKAIQSWADGRFSLLGHNHDGRYLRDINVSSDDYLPDWSKIQKVYFGWGNRLVHPIFHQLVPGTWITSIQGCGGDNPITSILAAKNPTYLLGNTERTTNASIPANGGYPNSAYSPSFNNILVLNCRNNKVGHEMLSTHIVPGTSTYVKPQPIGQCSNHPYRVYFVPDKIASDYGVYVKLVGTGAGFAYANYNDVFFTRIAALTSTVLAGDWKSNFNNKSLAYTDNRGLDWGAMFGMANDGWKWCYPTYIPPTPMAKTNSNFYYNFIGNGKVLRLDWRNDKKYLSFLQNDGDAYPRGYGYIESALSEDAEYVWSYWYQGSSGGDWTTKTVKLKLYDMLDA